MVRAALLMLALALGGGPLHLGSLLDLTSALWASDQVDAGNQLDPDGARATGDAGNILDPNGATATGDAGNQLDPNG
jgi:hypothetical protein